MGAPGWEYPAGVSDACRPRRCRLICPHGHEYEVPAHECLGALFADTDAPCPQCEALAAGDEASDGDDGN